MRIFGYDAAGAVDKEIAAADADITWTVSVANTKAAWYDYDRAMDLPVAVAVERRNADVTGADRERLVVATGGRSLGGPAANPVALDAGHSSTNLCRSVSCSQTARALGGRAGGGSRLLAGSGTAALVRQQRRVVRRHL